MGAIFSRLKTWVSTEDVTYSDLNAEFDNILNNLVPAMIDDYSITVSQMQTTTDPGEVGTESLATTLAGEIARLRFMIKEITGETQWYTSASASIAGLANAVGSGLTNNRLVSGRVRSTSDQPQFLVPNGAARTVKLDGTPTNFIYYIEGIEYTIDADVTITNLTAAPSSNNTCLVNDAVANDQEYTKHTGEGGSEITIDTVGSEITALVGKYAAFKLAGVGTEYFIAKVETNKLIQAKRGYFFDSTDAAIPRTGYTNNDVITLMKLTWVFAKSDETLTVTYNNPIWSFDEPSSPSIGDYWFDYANNKWRKYDVSSYIDADAMLVGVCIQDTTNTVAARSFEFFANYNNLNTVELGYESATQVKSRYPGSQVSVWGSVVKNDHNIHTWDMTLDLDSGVTEAASTYYYFYITEDGDKVISDVKPYNRIEDLLGMYHPHNSWRCVGSAFNNGSSNIEAASIESFYSRYDRKVITPTQTAASIVEVIPKIIRLDGSGGAFSEHLPTAASCAGQELTFIRTDNTPTNAVTLDPFGAETINAQSTFALYTLNERIKVFSDGSNWLVTDRYAKTYREAYTPTLTGINTPTGINFVWWRDGIYMFIDGVWTTGTTSATELRVSLAHSFTTVSGLPTLSHAGGSMIRGVAAGTSYTCTKESSVAYITFTSQADNGMTKSAANSASNTGNTHALWAQVPITGWQP